MKNISFAKYFHRSVRKIESLHHYADFNFYEEVADPINEQHIFNQTIMILLRDEFYETNAIEKKLES